MEKFANRTEGRWTRGLHKKTSDQIAEQHLKMLGQSQMPAEPPPPAGGGGGGGDETHAGGAAKKKRGHFAAVLALSVWGVYQGGVDAE